LGQACAVRLAREGAKVVRCEVSEKAVKSIKDVSGARAIFTSSNKQSAPAAPHAKSHGRPQMETKHLGKIIAVLSGKGGVGKSTTAANLACALAQKGLRVGLLDADVYGPSVPRLFGLTSKPETKDNKLVPLEKYNLKIMSIGFMVEEETPVIWRGAMVQTALKQMLNDVAWGELDSLVIDMPPGTGDAQLTLAQNVPMAGAVIVSTPQDLALIDARKAIAMFRRVEIPILGIIENMSSFICPACGTQSDIFGHGGARHEAERIGEPFLGEIPLTMRLRETSDAGTPITAIEPGDVISQRFKDVADKVWQSLQGNTQRAAPTISIED
ncbi:MAG: Mrp/NBP35 family ATP-binding protein, partial [Alphaproteobacteria bacterium]|nr:Mrp/NBP35 family ATP-binding protein [Alphaproteobacteria bacterium]